MKTPNLLFIAGLHSMGVSALHLLMIPFGSQAYRFFGAGERMAREADAGLWIPHIITFIIAMVFLLFGMYAWSGTGFIRKLPFLKPVLLAITGIYILRGIALFPEVYFYFIATHPLRFIIFSGAALWIGVFYVFGLKQNWQEISR